MRNNLPSEILRPRDNRVLLSTRRIKGKRSARTFVESILSSVSLSDFLTICREADENSKFIQLLVSLSDGSLEMGQFFAYRNDVAIYRRYLVQFCASISLLRKSGRPIVNGISFTSKIHSAAASNNTLLSA